MISSPKPNEATTNSSNNSQQPSPTLPSKTSAPNNSYSGYRPITIPPQQGRQYVDDRDGIQEPLRSNWWQRLSLRNKATALAIAIGTIPVLALGTINYFTSSKDIRDNVIGLQKSLALSLGDELGRFMFERYADVQTLSGLRAFSDPSISAITSRQEKEKQLNRFVEVYKLYDNIAVFSLNGNVIAQSKGEASRNVKNENYFRTVLETERAFISQPTVSRATGNNSIYITAPIKNSDTNETIAVMRTRMPVSYLNSILSEETARLTAGFQVLSQDEYHIVDSNGKIFVAKDQEELGGDARTEFEGFDQIRAAKQAGTRINVAPNDKVKQLIAYAPIQQVEGTPELNWSLLLAEPVDIAFGAQRRLLLTLLIGTGLTALVVAAIAAYLANRATRPIAAAANAVQRLGQGELDTRVAVVRGQDELAVLGFNINRMAGQIQNLLVKQEESSRQQSAIQEQAVRQQTENAQQQTSAKEKLQKRALELLMEVDPISRGDLTTRASVTEDEIGTIADSYNATVENLRKLVTQVQTAAQKMAATTSSSEASVQELSTEALRQTEEIAAALEQIQEMSNSTRAVAKSAEQAEVAVQQANRTVKTGEAAMNRTVDGILAIRETVADTSTKVQRLGEASQRISKVVNLISRFAAQTNLLALKASIEAARAGEEGRGFAIIADEVRALASQSAQATTEIESLVLSIQTETNEVAAAMESGTEQVVEGTRLVNETRQSLNNITAASAQIGALVEAIASNAVTQSQASESVTTTMSNVAVISNKTSNEAIQVSASFKELLEVANELQASAGQFKVS